MILKNETTNLALEIDLLRTFHAVARLGRFRAAAEHVHRSPAAVSVHIQRLEAVAGGRLLERDNQSVSLTPLGRRLLKSTTALLQVHDKVLDDLHGNRLAGRIKFGVPDEYAAHIILDILPLFAAKWPNVMLEVITAPSVVLRGQLARGRLHVAVASQLLEDRPHPHALAVTTPVWVGGVALQSELPDPLPLALYAADCPYRSAMLETLKQAGRAWRVVLSSASSQAVKACVEAGLAVSLIDRSRMTGRMRILENLPVVPTYEVILLRAPASQSSPAVDLLCDEIQGHFRL